MLAKLLGWRLKSQRQTCKGLLVAAKGCEVSPRKPSEFALAVRRCVARPASTIQNFSVPRICFVGSQQRLTLRSAFTFKSSPSGQVLTNIAALINIQVHGPGVINIAGLIYSSPHSHSYGYATPKKIKNLHLSSFSPEAFGVLRRSITIGIGMLVR